MGCIEDTAQAITASVAFVNEQIDMLTTMEFEDFWDNLAIANLVEQLADAVGSTVEEMIATLKEDAESLVEIVQKLIVSAINLVADMYENFRYYYAIRKLKPYLEQRIEVTDQIANLLYELKILAQSSVFIRATPTASKEVQNLLSLLYQARRAIDETFLSTTQVPDLISGKMKFSDVYKLREAFKYLEEAQNFLNSLLKDKYIKAKEKEFLKQWKTYTETNMNILVRLMKLIPVLTNPFAGITQDNSFIDNAESLGLSFLDPNAKELASLNTYIGKSKKTLKTFDTEVKPKLAETNAAFQGKAARFKNKHLDTLIAGIEEDKPRTLAGFAMKAPIWYGKIEYIKYQMYIDSPAFLDRDIVSTNAIANLGDLLDDEIAETFHAEMSSQFAALVSVIYIGNLSGGKSNLLMINRLGSQAHELIRKDRELLTKLRQISTSTGYTAFAAAMDAGINALGAAGAFAEHTPYVVEAILNGDFMSLGPMTSIASTLNALKSLYEQAINFDCSGALSENNVFPNSTPVPTPHEQSLDWGLANTEVMDGTANNMIPSA